MIRGGVDDESLEDKSLATGGNDVGPSVTDGRGTLNVCETSHGSGRELLFGHFLRMAYDAEKAIPSQSVRKKLLIPRLEDMQGQGRPGKKNQGERKEWK
jgi:hypothetical protein